MIDGDAWFILSAKHGVLYPGDIVEPYDETLVGATKAQARAWAQMVMRVLSPLIHGHRVVSLAGESYMRPLRPLWPLDVPVELPMGGLSLGKRLQFLGAS